MSLVQDAHQGVARRRRPRFIQAFLYPRPGLNVNTSPSNHPGPRVYQMFRVQHGQPREHQSIVQIPIAQATFLQKSKLVLGCWFPKFRRDLRTTMQFGVCKYTCYMQGPSNRQGGDMQESTCIKYTWKSLLFFQARYVPKTNVHKLSICTDRHPGTALVLKEAKLVLKGLESWQLNQYFCIFDFQGQTLWLF